MKKAEQPIIIWEDGEREPIVLWPAEAAQRAPYDFYRSEEEYGAA